MQTSDHCTKGIDSQHNHHAVMFYYTKLTFKNPHIDLKRFNLGIFDTIL